MTVRDSSLRAAALVTCAAALLVSGCGGGKGGATKPLGGSNNTSVCYYTKRFGKGRVYVEIDVSPVSLKSTTCSAFNARFGGRSLALTNVPRTGPPHCRYNKLGSSYDINLGVLAAPHTGTGRAFCRSFDSSLYGYKEVGP